MKKLLILLLLPTLMFSQKKDETVVRLDSLQAKIIALELVDCEFTRKELSLISTILEKTEDKIALKDAIIKIMEEERLMVDKILESKDELLANAKEQIRLLEKINKREKTKKWVNKAVYLGVGIAGTYFLLK
jgi:hypothetical protein